MRDLWDELLWSWAADPFAAAMAFLAGLAVGLAVGSSVMWWAVG